MYRKGREGVDSRRHPESCRSAARHAAYVVAPAQCAQVTSMQKRTKQYMNPHTTHEQYAGKARKCRKPSANQCSRRYHAVQKNPSVNKVVGKVEGDVCHNGSSSQ